MLDTAQVLRLMLGTLALGVTLPIMLQLFLLLRQVRKTIARVSDQIEPTLQLVHDIAQRPQQSTPETSSQLASIVATIIPAAVAAYRAFRQHQKQEESGTLTGADCDERPVSPPASARSSVASEYSE